MLVFQALLVSKRKQNRINFAILHWKWVPLLSSKHNHGIYGTYLIHWKNILCWTYALFPKLFCLLLFGFGWSYFLLQPEGTISIISIYKLDTYIFSSNFNESQVCVRNLRVSFLLFPLTSKEKFPLTSLLLGQDGVRYWEITLWEEKWHQQDAMVSFSYHRSLSNLYKCRSLIALMLCRVPNAAVI